MRGWKHTTERKEHSLPIFQPSLPIDHGSRFTCHVLHFMLALCLLVGFGGCSGSATNFQLSPADVEKLQPILDELQVGYDLTSTLRISQMIVTIEEKGQKEEVRESLWYKKSDAGDDLLHIQALGAYNEPRVIAIAARKRFLLYMVNEEEAILEALENQVLEEIFGMDLRISDVRSAIFANPFLDERTRELSLVQAGTKYIVARPGIEDGQIEKITIFVRDSEPQVSDWEIRDKDGTIVQQTKFSDYRDVGGIFRPHKVEIKRPIEETRVVLKIVKPEINLEVSDKKFQFDFLPEGTKFRTIGQ